MIAIFAAACGLHLVGRNPRSLPRLIGASVFTGLGVASMHYTGMYAMEMPARMTWNPGLVVLSVLIAVGASFAALVAGLQPARQPAPGGQRLRDGPRRLRHALHRHGRDADGDADHPHAASAAGPGLLRPFDGRLLRHHRRGAAALGHPGPGARAAQPRARRGPPPGGAAIEFKSRFLAGMSHELRTPLTAILGFAELLERDLEASLDARHKEFMGLLTSSARHLLDLVNEVLDLSRIEAGHLTLSPARTSVRELVHAAVSGVKSLTALRGVHLEIGLEENLPALFVDPMRIKQVLYNLLSNAIKFTPAGGGVTLEVRQEGDQMAIAVSDTGIGIRTEDLPRLFQEFERLAPQPGGPASTTFPEGTGLGLALSRRLIEKHGGTIAVESAPGRGSTFTVRLPIDPAAVPLIDPAAAVAAAQDLGRRAGRARRRSCWSKTTPPSAS